jgi:hypothetical protein
MVMQPDEFGRYIEAEIVRRGKLIKGERHPGQLARIPKTS